MALAEFGEQRLALSMSPQPSQRGQHCPGHWGLELPRLLGVCDQSLEGKCGLHKPKERPDVLNNPSNAEVYSYDVYRFKILNMLIISFQKISLLISGDLTSMSDAKFGRHISCLFIQLQIRHVALQSPKLSLNKVSQT